MDRGELVVSPRKIVAACQRLRFYPKSGNSEIVLVEKIPIPLLISEETQEGASTLLSNPKSPPSPRRYMPAIPPP